MADDHGVLGRGGAAADLAQVPSTSLRRSAQARCSRRISTAARNISSSDFAGSGAHLLLGERVAVLLEGGGEEVAAAVRESDQEERLLLGHTARLTRPGGGTVNTT